MQRIIRLITALFIFIALPVQAAQVAGEVTAAIGEAQIVASAGDKRAAAQGMPLHVGDILQTGAGGHIHIRMVDDALVSLRPNSALKIASYAYQPGVAATTKIRFDLLRGTVRSVTGKGGELAKDRFRMNTPVAAIGVRGTDFIAQADAEKTLVHVASGAIVLAPLGAGCQENTLGACQTAAARVLTAEMSNMMLEFTRGMVEPRLVPLSDKLQSIASPPVKGDAAKLQSQSPAEPSGATPLDVAQQNTLDSLTAQQPPAPAPVVVAAPAPAPAPAPAVPVHHQMVWGHWAGGIAGDELGSPFVEAAQGREAIVGTGGNILFRDNAAAISLPRNGRADFTLRMAQVSLPQAGGAIAGLVQNGTLGVDFNVNRYDTRLDIQHPSLAAPVALIASGGLRDDGLLMPTNSATGRVAGSLSRDATEAGYLFELSTTAGTLVGTTLWNR